MAICNNVSLGTRYLWVLYSCCAFVIFHRWGASQLNSLRGKSSNCHSITSQRQSQWKLQQLFHVCLPWIAIPLVLALIIHETLKSRSHPVHQVHYETQLCLKQTENLPCWLKGKKRKIKKKRTPRRLYYWQSSLEVEIIISSFLISMEVHLTWDSPRLMLQIVSSASITISKRPSPVDVLPRVGQKAYLSTTWASLSLFKPSIPTSTILQLCEETQNIFFL